MTLDKQKVTVAVVGGYSPDWDKREESPPLREIPVDYAEAGRAIGCALAEAGHPVVLCVPDWTKPRLGDAVLQGITKARLAPDQSAHAVTVYVTAGNPQEDNKDTLAEAWQAWSHKRQLHLEATGRGPQHMSLLASRRCGASTP